MVSMFEAVVIEFALCGNAVNNIVAMCMSTVIGIG